MTDHALDAAADGQFTRKLGDPSDGLTKRGGKGHVVFEGREYSRLEWTIRIAALGGTLNAGEGALLVAELERVRALVWMAFHEGLAYPDDRTRASTAWHLSRARAFLETGAE